MVITLAVKFLMVALGILGGLSLWLAVIGDDGMPLIVIANALLLL